MFNEKIRQWKEELRLLGQGVRKRAIRKNLVNDLQTRKISAKDYAEKTPIIVKRKSQQKIVTAAMERYRFLHGMIYYEEALNDADEILMAVREYSAYALCDLYEDYNLVKGLKGEKTALKTLTDRTIAEIEKEYPWIGDEYYLD